MNVIYAIVNLKTGKKYIGSSTNFSRRKYKHIRTLRKNIHHSQRLQNSWNKHGEEAFRFVILEKITDNRDIKQVEQVYLDTYRPFDKDKGYNMSSDSVAPTRGKGRTLYQFSMNGEFINKYNSSLEAGEDNNCDPSSILKCAKGKYRYYRGYIWSFDEILPGERVIKANSPCRRTLESRKKMSEKAKQRTDLKKPILQYDLNGNFIKEWESTSILVKETNYSNGYISDCLHGKHKKAYGYIWKFK